MDFELKGRVKKSLVKADNALTETRALYSMGHLPGTINRAYYAIFHSAAAVLLSQRMEIIKPSAIVPFFDREVVKKDLIETSYQRIFVDAYECFQMSEFDIYEDVNQARANSMLDMSQAFYGRMETYLRDNSWV